MKRRKFILTAVAATAALTLPVIHYRCRSSIAGTPLSRPLTLACFCDEETIREIGKYYISITSPGEKKRKKLEDMIMNGYGTQSGSAIENEKVSDWIENKVQEDFVNQRIVTVNGWILSETEARQCALLSLS